MIARRTQHRRLLGALSISGVTQALSSGTNFALTFYLVRVMDAESFGFYGIGFATSLLLSGILSGLIATQMVVLAPEKPLIDRVPYVARMLTVLLALSGLVVGAALVVTAAVKTTFLYADLLTGIAVAGAAYALKDFLVRYAYTVRKETWALYINGATALGLILLLVPSALGFTLLSPTTALFISASANVIGSLIGIALAGLPLTIMSVIRAFAELRSACSGGVWAAAGVIVAWAQTQSYVYVTAFALGPVGVAAVNAARLFVTPAFAVVPALTQIIMPRFVSLRLQDETRLLRLVGSLTIWFVVAAGAYSAVLLVIIENEIVTAILGSQYSGLELIVISWCVVLLCHYSRVCSSTAFQAMRLFRYLTVRNILSACVAVLSSILLISSFGVMGAVVSVALGEILLSLFLFRKMRKLLAKSDAWRASGSEGGC